jgi:D-alanyl-lipoteichoic acid acyltransferase DltB (MBOAT superfamily)
LEGGILWVGAIYFAFQIYCDFSGYSDIAIGTAKLFGFELISNFKFPYFSRNIGEFWRRWHISLSSWFRDYLYIPLGGSKKGTFKSIRNIFIIFIVSGFWHGANWTFIIWGLFHSLLFIPSFIFKTNRNYVNTIIAEDRIIPEFKEFFQVFTTFILVVIGWVFFRSETLTDSFYYLFQMFFSFSVPSDNLAGFLFVVPFLILEYFIRHKERLNFKISENLDLIISTLIIFCIILFYNKSSGFIYFQF